MPLPGWALTHTGKTVEVLHSPDGGNCAFFMLTGIRQADPVVPNGQWFAVPQTHVGYKEMLAILMVARLDGRPITVVTTGDIACGHAGVAAILF